jgi:hypothetical protein
LDSNPKKRSEKGIFFPWFAVIASDLGGGRNLSGMLQERKIPKMRSTVGGQVAPGYLIPPY